MEEKVLKKFKEMRENYKRALYALDTIIEAAEKENNGEIIDEKDLAAAIGTITMAILNLKKLDI